LGRRCAKVIAVSDAVRAHVLTRDWLPPQKVVTICNGVDLSPFAGTDGKIEARKTLSIEPDAFVVGTVGRLDNQKGHKFLIEAAKLLRNKIPKLKVVIVGHGSLHDDLVSRIQKEGVGDCVLLTGERRDISHVLKSFDVFAMPSLWEGLPIALLEAMASRLPIITTPVGGIPEFMRDGVNGLMIPVGDTARLAEAIQKLSGDRGFADKLALQGLETVTAKFGADTMVAQLKVIYEQAQKELKK
jgi:glycosyltransferase involved in cell wall biosynthesis